MVRIRVGYLKERENGDADVVKVEPPRVHPDPRGVEAGPGAALGRARHVHLGHVHLGAEDAGAVLPRGYRVVVARRESGVCGALHYINV